MKESHDEIDLFEYIKIIYRNRRVVLTIVGVCMLVSGVLNMRQPAMYEATIIFFPIEARYNVMAEGVTLRPKLDVQDLVVSIIESRRMADRVVDQLDLKKVWSIDNMTLLENILKGSISINVDRGGLIRLSVRTSSAELSAKIANAYVENIDYFNKQFDISAKYNVVEVLDRAIVPDKRMPRNTVKNVLIIGIYSFIAAISVIFSVEFFKKNKIIERLTHNN